MGNVIFSFGFARVTEVRHMKWDENETLHWIMRWQWMRWKQNLPFNNDDGEKTIKKTIYKNYLH